MWNATSPSAKAPSSRPAIIEAQIAPIVEPLVSAIPAGTKLRTLFVTRAARPSWTSAASSYPPPGRVDQRTAHGLTIVKALTANLPAVTSVQVLVDGKEIETLAGHVDLRRPLARNVQ